MTRITAALAALALSAGLLLSGAVAANAGPVDHGARKVVVEPSARKV